MDIKSHYALTTVLLVPLVFPVYAQSSVKLSVEQHLELLEKDLQETKKELQYYKSQEQINRKNISAMNVFAK